MNDFGEETESQEELFDNGEKEVVGDEMINHPFDPTRIRVEPKVLTIDALCSRIEHGEINLSPKFQRFNDIWTDEVQSRLVESLLIRIPIPAFYVDATNEDMWIVIDGLQRMTVLQKFVVLKNMKLKKLEFLTDIEGASFNTLHRKFQRRILETQITVFAIQPGTPPDVKFNIFKRVNTGGSPLTGQEIRHAMYQGPATDLLRDISDNSRYRQSPGVIQQKRMADRELILRYFAYLRLDPMDLERETLEKRLNGTMKWLNKKTEFEISKMKENFFSALRVMEEIWEKLAFRKPGAALAPRRPPINKPLFEAWMVTLTKLKKREQGQLLSKKQELKVKYEQLFSDEPFMMSVFEGTGKPEQVKKRFSEINRIVQEVLVNA